jgi:hypothetical protein
MVRVMAAFSWAIHDHSNVQAVAKRLQRVSPASQTHAVSDVCPRKPQWLKLSRDESPVSLARR